MLSWERTKEIPIQIRNFKNRSNEYFYSDSLSFIVSYFRTWFSLSVRGASVNGSQLLNRFFVAALIWRNTEKNPR